MPDQLLHKFIYVLLSGFTEFLPVSPRAHQLLYELLTGFRLNDTMVSLAIHLGTTAALILNCKKRIQHLFRANRIARYARRHRNTHVDTTAILDTRVLKTAALPMIISIFLIRRAESWVSSYAMLALMLTLSGLLLFIPRIIPKGNKDGRNLSAMDSVIMGLGGALSAIPGFSGIGSFLSAAHLRGVDRNYALDTALLATIPVLFGLLVMDVFSILGSKLLISGLGLLMYFLMAVFAFFTGYLAIVFVRFLCMKTSFSRFSYYSWGMAMFTFMLYLLI